MRPARQSEPLRGQGATWIVPSPGIPEAVRPCHWPDAAGTAAIERLVCANFPGVPESVRDARHQVAAVLGGVPVADDVVFSLGEVASNAIVHSKSGDPGGWYTVVTDVLPGELVVVAVSDQGGPWKEPGADTYPHGLAIVAKLAASVSIDGDDDGRTVWAIFPWVPRPVSPAGTGA